MLTLWKSRGEGPLALAPRCFSFPGLLCSPADLPRSCKIGLPLGSVAAAAAAPPGWFWHSRSHPDTAHILAHLSLPLHQDPHLPTWPLTHSRLRTSLHGLQQFPVCLPEKPTPHPSRLGLSPITGAFYMVFKRENISWWKGEGASSPTYGYW